MAGVLLFHHVQGLTPGCARVRRCLTRQVGRASALPGGCDEIVRLADQRISRHLRKKSCTRHQTWYSGIIRARKGLPRQVRPSEEDIFCCRSIARRLCCRCRKRHDLVWLAQVLSETKALFLASCMSSPRRTRTLLKRPMFVRVVLETTNCSGRTTIKE